MTYAAPKIFIVKSFLSNTNSHIYQRYILHLCNIKIFKNIEEEYGLAFQIFYQFLQSQPYSLNYKFAERSITELRIVLNEIQNFISKRYWNIAGSISFAIFIFLFLSRHIFQPHYFCPILHLSNIEIFKYILT